MSKVGIGGGGGLEDLKATRGRVVDLVPIVESVNRTYQVSQKKKRRMGGLHPQHLPSPRSANAMISGGKCFNIFDILLKFQLVHLGKES